MCIELNKCSKEREKKVTNLSNQSLTLSESRETIFFFCIIWINETGDEQQIYFIWWKTVWKILYYLRKDIIESTRFVEAIVVSHIFHYTHLNKFIWLYLVLTNFHGFLDRLLFVMPIRISLLISISS